MQDGRTLDKQGAIEINREYYEKYAQTWNSRSFSRASPPRSHTAVLFPLAFVCLAACLPPAARSHRSFATYFFKYLLPSRVVSLPPAAVIPVARSLAHSRASSHRCLIYAPPMFRWGFPRSPRDRLVRFFEMRSALRENARISKWDLFPK